MGKMVKRIISTCGSGKIQLILCMIFVVSFTGVGHALTYTSSWVGNTYGTYTNHILQDVLGMFVDPSGKTYCITNWDEGGTNVQVFNTDGSLNGKVYESGTGSWDRMSGTAVCGDGTYIYQAESQGTNAGTGGTNAYGGPEYPNAGSGWQCIRRYNISTGWGAPWTGGAGFDGSFLIVNTDYRAIKGIAYNNNELYVAEQSSNLIKVYNASIMSNTVVRSWSVSDPGQLYFDGAGYLWMFQPTNKRLIRYSTTGVLQSQSITFGEGIVPTGFGIDRVNHKIYVANNGVDQNILIYSNITSSPMLTSTFGTTGGIYSGIPGQVAPLKFNWPRGVGVDNNGNIYVASSPTLALGSTMLEKYDSFGTRLWAVYGLEFVDCACASSASENDVYTKEEHFTMNYSQPVGQQWSYTGYTLNRFKYPDDPRLHTSRDATYVRDFAGKRFLYMTDMYAGQLMVYRFDYTNDGECAIPCGIFSKAPMSSGGWPPNEPQSGEYIWCDEDGDGTMDSTEYHQPETVNTPNGIGWYVDDGGNVWFAEDGALRRYAMGGLDAHGTPKYSYTNMTTYSLPSPFNELRRVVYQTSTDTLFLTGYSSTYPNGNHTDEWKGAGRLLCCYKNWMNNGNRTANWQVVLPDCTTQSNLAISLDVAGNYLFSVTVPEIITVYRTSDGNNMGTISPTEYGFVGWVDITNGISALQRSTGSDYLIFQEEDFSAKVIMYQWNDGSAAKVNTPVITPSTGTYDAPQSVLIRCSTTGATIRYTTDGTEPTSASPVYSGAINVDSAMTLKAKAFKSGSANSDTSTAVYSFKCLRPTFNPAGGTYSDAQSVTISTATSGASIRYTTDGTNPTPTTGTLYSGPLSISSATILKAIAYKSGYTDSAITSGTYIITNSMTNIAPTGVAYRWSANSSSVANTNKVAAPGLNDGDYSVDVLLNGGTNNDFENAWEAAGITWSTPMNNIISIAFTNGSWNADYNGAFSANLGLQVTTDGSTWTNTGWTFSPSYAYDTSAVAGVKYTFTGGVLNNVLGVRITGQVHTTYLYSYEAYVREVEVFAGGNGTVAAPTFSPAGGTYTSAQTVTISTTTNGASVRYTTDGTDPTPTTGTPYSGPVNISNTCILKAIAYLSDWANSSVTSGIYTISGSGLISGSVGAASGTINLTTEGTSDWAHWGYSNSTSFDHKSSGGTPISNFTQVGGTSPVRYDDCAVGYTWTDGTPTNSATATTTGVYINQPSGNGFSFTVPADTTTRTLKVYCGIWHSAGTLTATLSDGSATPYTNTLSALDSVANAEYTINYAAGSAGQTLTVTWLCAYNYGNITLQAATLMSGADSMSASTDQATSTLVSGTGTTTTVDNTLAVTIVPNGANINKCADCGQEDECELNQSDGAHG